MGFMAPPVPPTVSSVTYPQRNQMEIRTPGVPGAPGGGPIDLNSLYEMFRYKAATRAWEAQKQAELAEREMRLKEQMQRAQMDAMTQAQRMANRGGEHISDRSQAAAMMQGEPIFADASGGLYTGAETVPWRPGAAATGYYRQPGSIGRGGVIGAGAY